MSVSISRTFHVDRAGKRPELRAGEEPSAPPVPVGRVPRVARLMALAIRFDLDATLRELAYLKVTQMADCHVCWHYHEAAARRVGVNDWQLRDLESFEDSDAYNLLEKDILRFAEQWTLRGRIADDVMDRLKAALTPAHLVFLAATTAQANFTTRFNNLFGVELP
jgi:AhpD family alkylhydroperoxidase